MGKQPNFYSTHDEARELLDLKVRLAQETQKDFSGSYIPTPASHFCRRLPKNSHFKEAPETIKKPV